MSDISNPIIENALQGNLVELSQRNEHTHLQIQTLNEMVVSLRKENAKLRELVCRYSEYTDQDRCEGCVLKRSCDDGEIDECWQIAEIREIEKELGVLDE